MNLSLLFESKRKRSGNSRSESLNLKGGRLQTLQVRKMHHSRLLPMQGDAHHADSPVTRTGTHNSHTHTFLTGFAGQNHRKTLKIGQLAHNIIMC